MLDELERSPEVYAISDWLVHQGLWRADLPTLFGGYCERLVAADLPISRQAVAKHLAVLRDAGLVEPERAGRETLFSARSEPLTEAGRWLMATGSSWDDRLARLARHASSRTAR